MLHLIKYNLLVKLKNFATTFWPLIFPILLGTMFYFAFGNIDDADFETVQVGIVKEDGADTLFLMFLDQIENNGNHLIALHLPNGKMKKFPVFIRWEAPLPLQWLPTESPRASFSPFCPATKPEKVPSAI